MPKGKPWTREQEKQLRALVDSRESLEVIASKIGKSRAAIKMKMQRLGLEVVVQKPTDSRTTTSKLVLPVELPSVEEALKMLAGALRKACEANLSKVEVQRLQVVSNLARSYKEFFAEYVDYRGIEAELVEYRKEYEQLAKKAQDNAVKSAKT